MISIKQDEEARKMKQTNPYSLSFGKEPVSLIDREMQNSEIIESFTSDNPAFQVCMLTGVRGSGKTVAMTSIAKRLRSLKEWIVVDLNPERDLLTMFAAELSNRRELFELFKDAKINLSFLGFGLEIDGVPPITDTVVALRRMLEKLTKSGKRVLVTIDEASASKQFREFASQFQIFMREGLDIFLLMTGLYENISAIQNEKALTFLYRAPKMELRPLNLRLIAKNYRESFGLEERDAADMAKLTMGYPFAFQLLGYLCWTRQVQWREALEEYDAYLAEYSYEKIWSECSETDKRVLAAMADVSSTKVQDVRSELGMASNVFSVYRDRLIKKGIVRSPSQGNVTFVLPRFRQYVASVVW